MGKKKNKTKSPQGDMGKLAESAVGKILQTTDGLFNSKPHIKKPRRVAVVQQRQDDGAVALAKISSMKGKEEKIGKDFIDDLVLSPQEHPALTENSIVNREVRFGIKRGESFVSIYPADLEDTGDCLTKEEQEKVQNGVHNDTEQHRQTYEKKLKCWEKHFK